MAFYKILCEHGFGETVELLPLSLPIMSVSHEPDYHLTESLTIRDYFLITIGVIQFMVIVCLVYKDWREGGREKLL